MFLKFYVLKNIKFLRAAKCPSKIQRGQSQSKLGATPRHLHRNDDSTYIP